MTVNELLQNWVNCEYEELLDAGVKAIFRLKPYINRFSSETTSSMKEKYDCEEMTLAFIIANAVIADRKITETEQKFITELFGITKESLDSAVRLSCYDGDSLFNSFVDSLDNYGKGALLDLLTSIFACDTAIPASEKGLLLEIYKKIS